VRLARVHGTALTNHSIDEAPRSLSSAKFGLNLGFGLVWYFGVDRLCCGFKNKNPGGTMTNQYQPQFGGVPTPQKTNGLAIASLVCSFFCGIFGIIFGIIAIGQINKQNQGGKGLAIAGISIGAVSIVITWLFWGAMFAASNSGY